MIFEVAAHIGFALAAVEAGARVQMAAPRAMHALLQTLSPSIVLLDEPAAGVHPRLLDVIATRIAELNARGMTFLIIEHNMDLITSLCSRLIVMAEGRLLCEGPPAAVIGDPRVVEAYLGSASP